MAIARGHFFVLDLVELYELLTGWVGTCCGRMVPWEDKWFFEEELEELDLELWLDLVPPPTGRRPLPLRK